MSVVTNASGLGIGGVLQVRRGDDWKAAAFFSRQTRGTEQCYSATELDSLALVETIRHFAYYLYGKSFVAYTDHKQASVSTAYIGQTEWTPQETRHEAAALAGRDLLRAGGEKWNG